MNRVDITAIIYYAIVFGGPALALLLFPIRCRLAAFSTGRDVIDAAATILFAIAALAWVLGPAVAWGSFNWGAAALSWSML